MNADARYRQVRERARARGLRMTPQREVLLRVVTRLRGHPTADELYRGVRRVLPSVSPATVYRNAQMLVHAGVLSVLERASDAIRYDANPEEHHHFICEACGRVVDVYLAQVKYQLDRKRSPLDGSTVTSCELQLRGRCPRCRRLA